MAMIELENKKIEAIEKLENFIQFNTSPPPQVEVETLCAICAKLIENYVPKYFSNIQLNPACENCQDSSI